MLLSMSLLSSCDDDVIVNRHTPYKLSEYQQEVGSEATTVSITIMTYKDLIYTDLLDVTTVCDGETIHYSFGEYPDKGYTHNKDTHRFNFTKEWIMIDFVPPTLTVTFPENLGKERKLDFTIAEANNQKQITITQKGKN